MKIDIYNLKGSHESAFRRLNESKILENNKELITEFDRHIYRQGLSIARRIKYLVILKNCAEMLTVSFEKATKKDIERLIEQIADTEKWGNATKRDYRIFIKRFYKWLLGDDEEYPKIVNWIRTGHGKETSFDMTELIKEEELQKLLNVTKNARDRAFIHVLFESGTRIGEIGTLKRKNIYFDERGGLIKVNGKTGERSVGLFKSVNDLYFWYQQHPDKRPEAPLWCTFKKEHDNLSYTFFRKILREAFEEAGIKKRYNPHLFRHSRLTYLSQFFSDQQLKIYAGWSKSSTMVEVYSHLTCKEINEKLAEINGVKIKNKVEENEKPMTCPKCYAPNNKNAQTCYSCHIVLDERLAQSIREVSEGDKLVDQIKSSPEAMKLLKQLSEVLNQEK
ncbi:site-specific integrase [Candidatus Woesearchaeota archaeon]|nr:site-specific integrase [Candidatus Woesearchaeota archaeon]